jgi:DNA-binding transcriptional MerR regulator
MSAHRPTPAEPEGPALTIGAAARRLGVATETLRSWERRYGLGPGARSSGARRRYTSADMARLDRFCRLVGEGVASADAAAAVLSGGESNAPESTAPESTAPESTEPEPTDAATATASGDRPARRPDRQPGGDEARGLARCAIRMDTAQVLALLEQAIARDGVIAAWESAIEPALRAVGRKWSESQGRYVEVEHLISWCVAAALHRVRPPDPAPASASPDDGVGVGRRRVLLACAPDEWHSLPMEVLRVALLERGVPVCMLGAAVPPDALQAAVRRLDPARVIVWSQVPATADLRALPRVRDPARSRVIAAGPGWSAARAKGIRVLAGLAEAVHAADLAGGTHQADTAHA